MTWKGVSKAYRAELAGLVRGRFTLLGAALVLASTILFAATVWVGPGGLADALLFDLVLVPTAFVPVAAWQVSHARSSRFLQAVFTTPVTQSEYVAARMLVLVTVGAAYVLAMAPYFLVQALHVGLPSSALWWPLIGLGMVAACTAVGTLVGVLFTSRGSLASLAVGVVLAAWFNAGWIMAGEFMRMQPGVARDALIRLTHTSPAVLALAAADELPQFSSDAPWRALLAIALLVGLAAFGAWWVFARAQASETWEMPKAGVATLLVLLVALPVAPVLAASDEYEPATHRMRGVSFSAGGQNVTAMIAERGAPLSVMQESMFRRPDLPAGTTFEADVLIGLFLPPNATQSDFLDVRVDVTSARATFQGVPFTAGRVTPEWAPPVPGSQPAPILRVPVTLTLDEPGNLTREYYFFNVTVSGRFEGASGPFDGYSVVAAQGAVPHIRLQMALAGLPIPLLCLGAFVVRRVRMR